MLVSFFHSLRSTTPQDISLDEIVSMTRSDEKLRQYALKVGEYKANGEKDSIKRIKLLKLPAFAPGAYLLDGKSRENLIGLTGMCFIDIDHLSEEQISTIIDRLRQDEHVIMMSRSVSGAGLHILIRYSLWSEDSLEVIGLTPKRINQVYGCVFKSTAAHYHEILSVPIDKCGMNAERLCLISFDSDVYYNPDAIPLVFQYERQKGNIKPKRYVEK